MFDIISLFIAFGIGAWQRGKAKDAAYRAAYAVEKRAREQQALRNDIAGALRTGAVVFLFGVAGGYVYAKVR